MKKIKKIAQIMSEKLGVDVKEKLVIKLPTEDGGPSHHLTTSWETYAASCGEFTLIAYDFGNKIDVKII